MIDVNELRRNNLVYRVYKTHKLIVKVLVIDDNFINYINNSKIEPIPLTEDMLLKCGFTEKDFEEGKIIVFGEDFNNIVGYIIKGISASVVIKTLHQLQNLYFALTGKELEVNF